MWDFLEGFWKEQTSGLIASCLLWVLQGTLVRFLKLESTLQLTCIPAECLWLSIWLPKSQFTSLQNEDDSTYVEDEVTSPFEVHPVSTDKGGSAFLWTITSVGSSKNSSWLASQCGHRLGVALWIWPFYSTYYCWPFCLVCVIQYLQVTEEKEELGQCDVKANTISQEWSALNWMSFSFRSTPFWLAVSILVPPEWRLWELSQLEVGSLAMFWWQGKNRQKVRTIQETHCRSPGNPQDPPTQSCISTTIDSLFLFSWMLVIHPLSKRAYSPIHHHSVMNTHGNVHGEQRVPMYQALRSLYRWINLHDITRSVVYSVLSLPVFSLHYFCLSSLSLFPRLKNPRYMEFYLVSDEVGSEEPEGALLSHHQSQHCFSACG